ncbi:hypothetical protein Tco_0667512 [Tanacetum coccineum]
MDNPNITMEEYIRLEEEKAQKRGKVFNWEIAKVSFDDSDDEDYTVIFDKNSFFYKIISVNDLKTDSENDNEKFNMPSLPPPEPMVSCFDDLDFFNDFENEFLAIVYNDALTSKLDFLTEPTVSPQHIDEFNLKDETSLSECDEEEQNVLNFNDLFPFNVIYPNDSKSDKDNDDDKVDIEHSSGDLSVKPLPDVINTDVGAYAHGMRLNVGHDNLLKTLKQAESSHPGSVPRPNITANSPIYPHNQDHRAGLHSYGMGNAPNRHSVTIYNQSPPMYNWGPMGKSETALKILPINALNPY